MITRTLILLCFSLLMMRPASAQSDEQLPVVITRHNSIDIYAYDLRSGESYRICDPPPDTTVYHAYDDALAYSIVTDTRNQRIAFAVSGAFDRYEPDRGADEVTGPEFKSVRIVTCNTFGLNARHIGTVEEDVIEFSPDFSPDGNKVAYIRGTVTEASSWEHRLVIYDFETQTEIVSSLDLINGFTGTSVEMAWGDDGIALFYTFEDLLLIVNESGDLIARHQLANAFSEDFFDETGVRPDALNQFIPRSAQVPLKWLQIEESDYLLMGILPVNLSIDYDLYLYDPVADEVLIGRGRTIVGYEAQGEEGMQVWRSREGYRYCYAELPYYHDNFAFAPDGQSFVSVIFEVYPTGGTAYHVERDGVPGCIDNFPRENFHATALDALSAGLGRSGAMHIYWGEMPMYIENWQVSDVLPTEKIE